MRLLYYVAALVGVSLCVYGIYCVLHMREYIGTGEYWSNPWLYKASAVLCGVVALRSMMSWVKGRTKGI